MKKFKLTAPALAVIALFSGCSENPLAYQKDTHSRGREVLYLEDSYKPLFETAIYTFEGQFPKANLVPEYCTQQDAIGAIFTKKTNAICISRDLNKTEKADLKKRNIEVRSSQIAVDAVALIVHRDNKDTLITVEELKKILRGEKSTWENGEPINVVFDKVNSANFQYLRELSGNSAIPANVFAVKSNSEVLRYVKDHSNALGVIGVNWISDEDDKVVQAYRSGISTLWVAKSAGKPAFQPFQGDIASKEYPLTREVWLINKGSRAGLSTGFVNWMEKDNGQLLVQKCGLVAARPVERNLQITIE
jgi:phosphate transport system substrate-binding protein